MAMIRQHPAPGVEQLPPGLQAYGRTPRPGIGMLVDAYFPMPQNPVGTNALNKSLLQVSGAPTSIGPSRTEMHGIGNYHLGGLADSFGDLGQYGVLAIGALLIGAMFFGGKKSRGGHSRPAAVTV